MKLLKSLLLFFTLVPAIANAAPVITSISPIASQAIQTIVIKGSGFGSLQAYTGDSNFIKIIDVTTFWSAGSAREGNDAVTLNITSWTDTQITVAGFTGWYGSNGWVLNDKHVVSVQIWNAQTAAGPAVCSQTVGSGLTATCSTSQSTSSPGIKNVTLDDLLSQITITGTDLKNTGDTIVTLGSLKLTNLSQTKNTIVVQCPVNPAICSIAGDWLLQVNSYTNDLVPVSVGQQIWNLTVGAVGPKGDRGLPGKDGTNGKDGAQGIQGLSGKNGAQGLAGKDGINGKDGAQGLKGDAGVAGVNGSNGKSVLNGVGIPAITLGTIGDFYFDTAANKLYGAKTANGWGTGISLVGQKGDTGAQGIKGDTGLTGATGAKGDKGDQGLSGKDGAQGIQGLKGDQGVAGINGNNGVNGKSVLNGVGIPAITLGTIGDFYIDTAVNKLYGSKTTNGWGVGIALVGQKGDIGLTGAAGTKGDKGEQGLSGKDGVQGIQGLKGDKGDTGLTGATGTKGDKGDQGLAGKDGAQGIQGVKGDQGIQGLKGDQGIQGLKGDTGLTGAVGAKGDTGSTGSQGPKGDTGATGPQPQINITSCTDLNIATRAWTTCPNNMVMVGIYEAGLATGSKNWYGTIKCCSLK